MGLFKRPKVAATSGNDAAYQELAAAREEARRLEDVTLPRIQRNATPPPPAQQTAADVAAAERMARRQMASKNGIQRSIRPLGGDPGML